MQTLDLEIAGLGIILYSPISAAHIEDGSDYLNESFWDPDDVARHLTEGQITAFCTGTPGTFQLRFNSGPPDEAALAEAEFKVQMGLQVHGGIVCVRDLYDMMDWTVECPPDQQLSVKDGWYLLTAYSSAPESGVLGDDQVIEIAVERCPRKPSYPSDEIPMLCD